MIQGHSKIITAKYGNCYYRCLITKEISYQKQKQNGLVLNNLKISEISIMLGSVDISTQFLKKELQNILRISSIKTA